MIHKKLEPRADILIEAMRSMGYTFESALADIIDNSIAALANEINISFIKEIGVISILDNGNGMSSDELLEAMRWGSKDPLMSREKNDLGRFGLGLKSASLSQCRKLTVVSKKHNQINALSWDLDFIRKTGEWSIIEVSDETIRKYIELDKLSMYDNGTLVVWENFDRFEISNNDSTKSIEDALDYASDYLSVIFHVFLEEGIKISVNNRTIAKIDPFLRKNSFTQILKSEDVLIRDKNGKQTSIKVTPYVLPHFSSLSKEDKQLLGKHESFRSKQGFYIYRNKRLLIWGTWFRMMTNNELFKNARVKVEIPNNLDDIWDIDIKKSTAKIPSIIKNKLFFSVKQSIEKSEKIYTKRAENTNVDKGFNVIWSTFRDGNKNLYKINRDLPMIEKFTKNLEPNQIEMLEIILSDIETNIPKYKIYTDISKGNDDDKSNFENDFERLCTFVRLENPSNKEEYDYLVKPIINSEPYCQYPNIYEKLSEVFKIG